MSVPRPPDPAKRVIGVFLKEKKLIDSVAPELKRHFGAVDIVSHWLAFDFTDYYRKEFGTPLFRRVFTFKQLMDQDALSETKQITNAIENRFLGRRKNDENAHRRVNIDPGYMLRERFVLATGKNFAHRIYVGDGIYADLTLIYQQKKFHPLPWTYPDYASSEMLAFLEQVRSRYIGDLNNTQQVVS